MVGQVTVVAILMIVQAALEILMGVVLMVMAFVMSAFVGAVAQQQQAQGGPPLPVELFTGMYVAMSLAGLLPGIFRLIAGIRGLNFHSRTFGIFSLLFGLLSLGTCYCSVTSIGLAIYGLIVYFNNDVARAFEMAEQGVPAAEIKRRYYIDPERFALADFRAPERTWQEEEEPPPREDRPPRHEDRDKYYGEGYRE